MNAIRKFRKDRNLTQDEAAKLLCVTKATVSRYESGERKIAPERVIEFERLTGIPRHELRPDLYPQEAA